MANVLIIDSEPAVAQALRDALAARGVDSHVTADGTDGLEYVRTNKPDLIILCVELTRGSGYSVCNKLKKDGGMASIPLILTSSQATEETFEQHKKLRTRAEAYIKKPFTMDLIMGSVGQYVKLGAASSGAQEVEVSIDELEVEIPNNAPQPAARRAATPAPAPADDEEFLDVSFDGEESGPKSRDPQQGKELFSSDAAPEPAPSRVQSAPAVAAPAAVGKANPQSEAELNSLRNEVKQLRARVQKLEQEAQEKEVAFNDRLLAESARARDALESKKKLTQVEREIAKYQQDAQKAQADAEAARAQARDVQAKAESIGGERNELTDKIAQLVDKLKEVAGERDRLKAEVGQLNDAQKSAMSGVETADKVREKAKKAVDIAMQLLEETRLVN